MKLFNNMWPCIDKEEPKALITTVKVFMLFFLVYLLIHMIIAFPKLVHAWDGMIELNQGYSRIFTPQENVKVNVFNDNDSRQRVEDSGSLRPGGKVQVTDSEGTVHEMDVIVVQEIEGGPVKIQGYLPSTQEYYDLNMKLR